jgi:HD-like signal output (HDOD) protein
MNVDQLVKDILADLRSNRLKLPTLPQVAIKINDIINNPDATTKSVARVISADAALSARMIQVANSPMVRAISPVDNVPMAITRMGMSMLRNVVTSFLVASLFHSKHQRLRERVATLWNHSVRVGAISHVLAERFSRLKPDEAMLAGLVHDIGKLPIIAKADDMPELADNVKLLDELSDRLHAKLGKIIVDTWGFTPAMVIAVAEHENLQRDSEALDLCDVITVANLLSYAGKEHRATKTDWTTVPAFSKLGLATPEDSIAVLSEAREEISQIISLLQ